MTGNQLSANVVTNLRFYRRNRLLVLVGIFVVLVFLITMVTSAFSVTKRFDSIQDFVTTADWFLAMMAALLGLVTISHHVRNRSLKLVITHPCTIESWVLSHFVSVFLVVVTLFAITTVVAFGLFLIWHVPVQWGLFYVVAWGMCSAMITFAFLIMLSSMIHPIVAALIAAVFGPSTIYWLITLLQVQIEIGPGGYVRAVNRGLMGLLSAVYYALPAYSPMMEQTVSLQYSFRVSAGDTYSLFLTVVYTAVFCALMYFLTCAILRRQRHI